MKGFKLIHLIILVFAISWAGVLPSLLIAHGVSIPGSLANLHILMTLGPILGTIIMIARSKGKQGLKEFFSRLFILRTRWFVILLAIGLPILVSGLAAAIGLKLSGTAWPDQYTGMAVATGGLSIFLMYFIGNTEELAWRGVVFDRLFQKHGYIRACLLIAPVWWLFHIPLFLYPNGHPAGYGLLVFTAVVLAQTFILGWIYIKSNRSLFYVHLHHQLINGFGEAFPVFPVFIAGNLLPAWTFGILLLLTALILGISYKKPLPSR